MTNDKSRLDLGIGDRVRIDIPDETDPDHPHHGQNGEIIAVIQDDGGSVTGSRLDDNLYRVNLDNGDTVDVRARDLRPPI